MKKEHNLILSVLFIIASIILLVYIVHAADEPSIPEIIPGLDVEKLSEQAEKTPEQLAEESSAYLRGEWAKIFQKNFPFLWSIHQYLLSHQVVFKILFKKEYSFTWIFLFMLILWIYLASLAEKIFDSLGFVRKEIAWVMGILTAVILAQINFINWIVNGVHYLVNSQEAWWMRLIIWVIVLILISLFFALREALGVYLKQLKKEKKEKEVEEKVEVLEAEARGREEKRKIEEKYPKSEGWQQVGSYGAHFRKKV